MGCRKNSRDVHDVMKRQVAYIALGSNLGDKSFNMAKAIGLIRKISQTKVTRISSIFRTSAEGKINQPNFLNAVVRIFTSLTAEELWRGLSQIEKEVGRVRSGERNEPRIIDLDILLYGRGIYNSSALTIPHPRMHLRRFVLEPLCEISPNLILPGANKPVKELLVNLGKR